MSKINAICCGGAAINIADKVLTMVSDLGDGFAKINYNYIDTSKSNIEKIEPRGDFWLVKTKRHSGGHIDGSGSERRKNAVDIMENVNEFLDAHKLHKKETGVYNMVVFSTSGGSGSTIGPVVVKNLLERDIPTFVVAIGDSSNGLSAINTINTLASLDKIAKTRGIEKPLGVIYINNHQLAEDGDLHKAEKSANKMLFNTLSSVALFLNGENEALDYQDMAGIIDQSHYSTIEVPSGLCGLTIYGKSIDLPKGAIPTVGRTLTVEHESYSTGLNLLHHKRGYVTNENALEIYKDQFPIHMIAYANFFKIEKTALDKVTEDYYNIMDSIKSEEVSGSSRSEVDDDTGLIF